MVKQQGRKNVMPRENTITTVLVKLPINCIIISTIVSAREKEGVGETGVGWGKFWLGQCHSVTNELPHGETNYVFGEQVTTAFTGSNRIIDAHFASEISPKITF